MDCCSLIYCPQELKSDQCAQKQACLPSGLEGRLQQRKTSWRLWTKWSSRMPNSQLPRAIWPTIENFSLCVIFIVTIKLYTFFVSLVCIPTHLISWLLYQHPLPFLLSHYQHVKCVQLKFSTHRLFAANNSVWCEYVTCYVMSTVMCLWQFEYL